MKVQRAILPLRGDDGGGGRGARGGERDTRADGSGTDGTPDSSPSAAAAPLPNTTPGNGAPCSWMVLSMTP